MTDPLMKLTIDLIIPIALNDHILNAIGITNCTQTLHALKYQARSFLARHPPLSHW